ncbi:sensor histidine kinase [Paenibacillus sp. 1P07SE]|uniref:sensor histidine kinase n=1 Tax=Paenibacillus sp. 1P07SE TaxID=3132209 RepID=UPI0039A5F8B3
MKVSRKIFLTIASFIVVLSVVYVLLTELVIRESLGAVIESTLGGQLDELAEGIVEVYEQEHGWPAADVLEKRLEGSGSAASDVSLLLVSAEGHLLYADGRESAGLLRNLGIKRELKSGQKTIASLYHYSPEGAILKKIQLGISFSTLFLLSASLCIFILLALFVAYRVSGRLTAPLRRILPAIERLGQGELGIQAPVTSKDEYATLAAAFNDMSRQLHKGELARRNLVADVAHELRTPLTIVQGKLEQLQLHGQPIEPERLLPLQDELTRLRRLVSDLHQLSLAEARQLPLERRMTNLGTLLERIAARIEPSAEDNDISLDIQAPADLPQVDVDPHRMMQVFLNLLVNAVRYTPANGRISIRVEAEAGHAAGKGWLRTEIADTGPGISKEHLPRLFDRFYRTDEARARNSGGMGLGLAIAREFVLVHDGTIEVRSTEGEGTVFVVRLPVAERPAPGT